jgi:hypothetical protein
MPFRSPGIAVCISLWGWGLITAQPAIITGKDPGYAGIPIEVYIPGHPFLEIPRFSETVACDHLGAFRVVVELETGTTIRFKTGIYDASLYAEPGKSYEVLLPAFHELGYADRISPFFERIRVPLKVVSPGDVNREIYRYDSLFTLLNEELILARRMGKKLPADSLIESITSKFETGRFPWFDDYRRYKAGVLKLNAGSTGLESISRDYLGSRVQENHPAYLELFGAMFRDFLIFYDRTSGGDGIRYHINRTHNLDSLRQIILTHPAVGNDTLTDLILLQELPDLFYRADFHKEAILILLDSMEARPAKSFYALYARQLKDKLSSLVIGHPPPSFQLTGSDGQIYSPGDFEGKYTYLMFGTPDHYGCMMEYPFLQSYSEKHSAYLEVVTIMVAESREQVTAFMDRNNYRWKALYYEGNMDLLSNYLVKAFPVGYLIGPDGKLVLSPAPLPSDGFEQQLFRIMRSRGEI